MPLRLRADVFHATLLAREQPAEPLHKTMSITLQTSIRRFLDHCRVGKRLSPHTQRAYSVDLAAFAAFAGPERPVETVTRDNLRDFARALFDDGGLKETTVRFWKWLMLPLFDFQFATGGQIRMVAHHLIA